MDYMKQIWQDYGLKEHTFYVINDLIMEVIKDKMSKETSEAVCCSWQLLRGKYADKTHNNLCDVRASLLRW